MNQQLTPHFNLDEFRCPCCHDVIKAAALELATALEPVRDDIGPIHILSGYRCFKHNLAIGGKTFSQHLVGLAVDVACQNSTHRFALVELALRHGFRRVGIGTDFVHLDIGHITGPILWLY